jgi:DNA mismatch repair protein MutL
MQKPEVQKKTIVFTEFEYLGQVAGTFLVFSSSESLTVVDQHAAHERVLFEKLKDSSRQEEDKMISQGLLIPEVVSLSPGDFAFLMEAKEMLEEIGISVEPFGGNAVVVKAIPAILSHIQPKEIITDLLDEFAGADRRMNIQEKKDMIFSFLACRGAVKANHELSISEVGMLCHDLDNTSFSSTCPHGRPVYISFSLKDMEKMFRRR